MIRVLDLAVLAGTLAVVISSLAGWEAFAPLVVATAYGVARAWPTIADLIERDFEGEPPEPWGEASLRDKELER